MFSCSAVKQIITFIDYSIKLSKAIVVFGNEVINKTEISQFEICYINIHN